MNDEERAKKIAELRQLILESMRRCEPAKKRRHLVDDYKKLKGDNDGLD